MGVKRLTDRAEILREALEQAFWIRAESERFQKAWPALAANQTFLPPMTWEQLERQLTDLAAPRSKAAMVPDALSALRKQAAFKPPEMVLREVLCVAWTMMDDGFRPEFEEAEMT